MTMETEGFVGITDATGNCYAACVASITGLPFEELKVDVGPPETWDRDKSRWVGNRMTDLLHERGWAILHAGVRIPVGFSIATGTSSRGSWGHCWVALDGERFFDPHPSREFTLNVDHYDVLVPILGLLPSA